ncbi:MAG: trypsin-like peptidase domain-containing protein [Pirellulales bacterium]
MRQFTRVKAVCAIVAQTVVVGLVSGSVRAEVAADVLEAEADRVATVKKISSCTIAVFGQGSTGGGSGVVISPDGYALSNFHVVKPSGDAMKCGMDDGKLYDAVVVGIDPTGDVAMLKLLGRDDFPTAELGDSDQVQVGDWAFAIGNPFLLATDFTPTVAFGIISGVHRYQYPAGTILEYADCLQTDAAINPGNSGGPLFNADGELIGINGRGSFEKRGRVNVGVGYAISINQIKHFMGYLKSGRIVDHATIGATASTDEDGRVVVDQILSSSDAFRRGVRIDDEIVRFGGRTIRTVNGFKNVMGIYPKGWRVPLTYRRDGETYNAWIRLTGNHSEGQLVELVAGKPRQPPGPKPKEGDKPGKDKEERPKIDPAQILKKKQAMPKIVKDHFKKKKGYANYYFNELHQQRVWRSLLNSGDFQDVPAQWVLTGSVRTEAGGGEARIELGPKLGKADLPNFLASADFDDELGERLDPPATGGLLVALHVWQRLLLRGIDDFGEVYYLGTAPLPGREGQFDVLVGIHGGVETRFFFDSESGRMLAVEMFPEDYTDPCELYFHDYREVDGRFLPGRMEVRHGEDRYGDFQFKAFVFENVRE